ncbi:hypothetical protein BBO99_00004016 [Phytophthora kernoviae]|uniref:START domain-containing protein n=2 Tax=Phytophthora kernoviae TaxID=325452 RepID=A0A3R7IJC3_9STRA|nr:hypothetical protein G195_004584 [Phytophthora kernoviae 00238/432]KAG2528273.1 hypothetical protein JM18_003307 [Phytophthora kernoviae]RLN21494.1 hypothetical protein BBI17_004158 [Phytophthora kernoviae]RLN81054.1 hypothetical protein BBO99_00004016 [Phytophthora kernoviae]
MPATLFAERLPELELSKEDSEALLELEAVLVAQNLEQYDQLLHCPKKEKAKVASPSSQWHEIRKVENLRIYEERAPVSSETPVMPTTLMLGSVVGDLDDIMYGVVAATDEDERIKERVLQDGAEESKVLRCLVKPSERDPFRQVSVKWQLYSTRDYVCLDTTGFARASMGERVGYSLSHSIAFDGKLPLFDRHSIDRGNRSVCVLYRQRTPNAVECYARGVFDFETKSDPVSNSVALQVIANQWLSHARIVELAHMKKIVCRLKQQVACGEPIVKARKPVTSHHMRREPKRMQGARDEEEFLRTMYPRRFAMSEQDGNLLRELAETLVVHNIQQYNTLLKTKDGFADTRVWKELRRKDGARIYRERSKHNGLPTTPSLLLLGTLKGTVDEIMYGAVTTTDKAIRIKSAYTQDGVINSKVLKELVQPTMDDPFHHVSVKWRLHNNQRDYVSLDATGIAHTVKRERIGYNISHSVAFAQIPGMEKAHGIERGNMSVCSLYHQKSPTTVECYVHQLTVVVKKGNFCCMCLTDAANTDSLGVARDELASSEAYHEICIAKAEDLARASIMQSAVSRRSQINNRSLVSRDSSTM